MTMRITIRLGRPRPPLVEMAGALGLDLAAELAGGSLAGTDLRGMTEVCGSCGAATGCAGEVRAAAAPAAPRHCGNGEILNRLADLR